VKAVIGSLLGFVVPETLACGVGSAMKAIPAWAPSRGVCDGPLLGGCHLGARQGVYPAILSPAGHFWTSIRIRKGLLPGAVPEGHKIAETMPAEEKVEA